MVAEGLSRKQLAEKHNVTSDRIMQWLLLLELPEHEQQRIEGLGDNWCWQIVTERSLRNLRREMYVAMHLWTSGCVLVSCITRNDTTLDSPHCVIDEVLAYGAGYRNEGLG